MNKTLLLILCDFLLLNLLALTRWEKAEPTRPARIAVQQAATGSKSIEQDLVETMRLSLADEQASRTQLASQLASNADSLAKLEADKSRLASSLDATQQKASELDKRLGTATQDAAAAQARIAQLQREFDLKQAEAARQKDLIANLERTQGEARDRIENLSVAVKVAEQEKVLLRQTADTFKQQVEAERAERQKVQETTVQLAQGVGQLAEKSVELTRELRDNRPINTNTLFNEFLANRVSVSVRAERVNSFLGPISRTGNTGTILVTDGTQVWALFHVDETPFGFNQVASNWSRISAELERGKQATSARSLAFLSVDPRIIALPLDSAQVAALGCKVYPLSADPFKFADAMLVSRGGGGYGETPFKLDPNYPTYVRMDNRFFKRLTGDFTPSRGDLVFSKNGEFLGIMVSSDFCAVVASTLPARTLQLPETAAQETEKVLSEMEARVKSLPFRMQ